MTSVRRLVVAAVATLLLASCASPVDFREASAAADGIRMVEEQGAPVAVPTELPASYAFMGHAGINRRDGHAVASAWLYSSEGAGPPVHVCVVTRRVDLDVCPVEVLHSHVQRGTERYLVIVSSADQDDPSIDAWEEAEFTEDWEGVKWIDETDA